jgi:hypothetical protein
LILPTSEVEIFLVNYDIYSEKITYKINRKYNNNLRQNSIYKTEHFCKLLGIYVT